jgi:hypothetical protein
VSCNAHGGTKGRASGPHLVASHPWSWPSAPADRRWNDPPPPVSKMVALKTAVDEQVEASGSDRKLLPNVQDPHRKIGQGNGPAKTVAKPGRCQHRGKAFAGSSIDFQKWTATSRGRLDARASHVERRAGESTQEWTSTSQTGVTPSVERHASGAKSRTTLPNRGERRPNRPITTQVEIDQRT